MGIKVEIVVGEDEDFRMVRALALVPGLVYHKAPDCPPGSTVHNITHVRSGLAIVRHIQLGHIGQARKILEVVDWTGLPEDFVVSEEHTVCAAKVNLLSLQQENRLAKVLGGKRQPASGSRWGFRRDVITPKYLIEAKTTQSSSYSLQESDLLFLRKQAYQLDKKPAYIIEIDNSEEIVVIPFWDLDNEDLIDHTPALVNLRAKKSFTINKTLAKEIAAGKLLALDFAGAKFLAMGYEMFLTIAKKGIDADIDANAW